MAYRKGLVLSFGILNVIVSADGMKDKESSLVSVCCGPDGGKEHAPTQIKQKLYCASCNDTVTYGDLKKAQVVGDQFVVVDQQELATTRDSVLGATKKMLTLTVHDAQEVAEHTLQGDSVYVLTPEGAPQIGAYSLLVDAIERHPEYAFLTTWTPTSKASLYQLKVFGGALVMSQVCWPEQVRSVPTIDTIEPSQDHQVMLDTLLTQVVQPFEPDQYADKYAAALAGLLAQKEAVAGVAAERSKSEAKAPASTGGVDLTQALAAMLGQTATPVATDQPAPAPTKSRRKTA